MNTLGYQGKKILYRQKKLGTSPRQWVGLHVTLLLPSDVGDERVESVRTVESGNSSTLVYLARWYGPIKTIENVSAPKG